MPVPLEPDKYYQIYNHANGNDDIFINESNYHYFLKKYAEYINPVTDTFAYCLMPNHFHFLIRLKEEKKLKEYFVKKYTRRYERAFQKSQTFGKLVSKEFSNLFSSYTQSFNKEQGRKGSLFMPNFKRKEVNDIKYLRKLVHYIHYNPVEHGFCEKIEDWKFSSYNTILSCKPTLLMREEVIELFEDRENIIYCHQYPPKLTGLQLFD
ncbi:MAG: hypothetical protein ABII90_06340 [Bacteroidota bacterium]